MIVGVVAGLLFGRPAYYLSLLWCCVAIFVFMVSSSMHCFNYELSRLQKTHWYSKKGMVMITYLWTFSPFKLYIFNYLQHATC